MCGLGFTNSSAAFLLEIKQAGASGRTIHVNPVMLLPRLIILLFIAPGGLAPLAHVKGENVSVDNVLPVFGSAF
jgi:hypothetical protein